MFRHATVIIAALVCSTLEGQEETTSVVRTRTNLPSVEKSKQIVDEVLAAELDKPNRVGFSVCLAYGDSIVVKKGYGMAELEHDIPVDTKSVFRIGSVTKQFTAALVLKYVEQGKLELDEPITKYTDFPTGDHIVTVRNLLSHTSGIFNLTAVGEQFTKLIPVERSQEELLDLVRGRPLAFEPGTRFAYSNTNYYLLGVILESIGGRPYGELVHQELVAPIGLTQTRYDSNSDIIKGRAQGYGVDPMGGLTNDGLLGISNPYSAGGLISTAGDLVRWQRALAAGEVISVTNYRLMNTPFKLPADVEPEYRYGFGRVEGQWDGHRLHFHGGGIHGFTAFLGHFPETDVTLALISNCQGNGFSADKVARLVWQALLAEST